MQEESAPEGKTETLTSIFDLQIQKHDGHDSHEKADDLSRAEFFTDHEYRIKEGKDHVSARDHGKESGSGDFWVEVDHQKIGQPVGNPADQRGPHAVANRFLYFRAIALD